MGIDTQRTGSVGDGDGARSEREHLVAALALANARLLEQLREREQIEEQLLNTRKMEAIGRLAGGVAHDFNNLLTVIRLQLSLLRKNVADRPAALGRIEEIDLAVSFARSLTSKLVAFSRRDPVRGERVDPAEVLDAMEPFLRRLCGHAIELRVTIERGPEWVAIDRTGLEQMLLNLVINARDAMSRGGALVIALERRTRDDRELFALVVRDSGVGMDAATRQRLFEPFFTTKGPERGTGLGLSTTYAMVMQAGGFIDVTSAPGQGSEFVVYLPRVDASTIPAHPPLDQPDASSATVLVVDDEDDVREPIVQLLASAGYHVIEASSGATALEVVAHQPGPIHLLLTDVAMPSMTGFTLATHLEGMVPGIAVVFMSGYLVGMPMAGARFLQKPFTPDQLLTEIRGALDAGRLAAAIRKMS